jgi:hypothetical protein
MSGRESPGELTIVVEVCMLAAFVELGRILVVAVQTGEMWFGVKEGQFPITLAMSPVLFSVLCIVCVVGAAMFWLAGVWPLVQRVNERFFR